MNALQLTRSEVLRKFAVNTPFAFTHHRPRRQGRGVSGTSTPRQVVEAFGFPTGLKRVTPFQPVITIGELGGGTYPKDLALFASLNNLPAPILSDNTAAGGSNSPGDDADGEVALDWQMAAAGYSLIIDEPALITNVWAQNNGTGIPDATLAAAAIANAVTMSWSWGSFEKGWTSSQRSQMITAVTGFPGPVFAASGDNDSGDGSSGNNVDCPACLPNVIGCGGVSMIVNSDGSLSLKVWNDGQGDGTGGGLSAFYPIQSFAIPALAGQTMRGVPDLAGLADPATGIQVYINGDLQVIGGTSAVAPFYAGIYAGMIAAGFVLPAGMTFIQWLYSVTEAYWFDVVTGNNGTYDATPGQDLCTGRGCLNGKTVFANLSGTGGGTTPSPHPPSAFNPTWTQATAKLAAGILTAAKKTPIFGLARGAVTLSEPIISNMMAPLWGQSVSVSKEEGDSMKTAQPHFDKLVELRDKVRALRTNFNLGTFQTIIAELDALLQVIGPIVGTIGGIVGSGPPAPATMLTGMIRPRTAVTQQQLQQDVQTLDNLLTQLLSQQNAVTAADQQVANDQTQLTGDQQIATNAATAVASTVTAAQAAVTQIQTDLASLQGTP